MRIFEGKRYFLLLPKAVALGISDPNRPVLIEQPRSNLMSPCFIKKAAYRSNGGKIIIINKTPEIEEWGTLFKNFNLTVKKLKGE